MPEEEPLAWRILRTLAEDAAQQAQQARTRPGGTLGMSLPRLGKRLGQSASVLLRALAPMGDAPLAGQRGAGWVRVAQEDGAWVAHLTAKGLAVARELAGRASSPGEGVPPQRG